MIPTLLCTLFFFGLGIFFVYSLIKAKSWEQRKTLLTFLVLTIVLYLLFLYNLAKFFIR